jgi:hypothetical protein
MTGFILDEIKIFECKDLIIHINFVIDQTVLKQNLHNRNKISRQYIPDLKIQK